MTGINAAGVQVQTFKRPSDRELDHDWMWRSTSRLPERGRIGIFDRSYYEEVLVVKVHPEILDSRPIPYGMRGESFWDARYEDINHMEQHLYRSGTIILKFFLHVSKKEQKNRFLDRLNEPDKHWKFSESDIVERQYWDLYMQVFEEAIQATSKPWAPWYVIPADNKWKMRALVSMIISETIGNLDLHYPQVSEEKRKRLLEIKKQLEQE
jgi:PPK2 family polyphosphate:nucleotide phosphotransferase